MALVSCSTCARHIRSSEGACPFCGAAMTDDMRSAVAATVRNALTAGPPLTRAAILFAGATVLSACGKETTLAAPAYGVPVPDPTTTTSASPPTPTPTGTEGLAVPAYGVPPPMLSVTPPSPSPNAADAAPPKKK